MSLLSKLYFFVDFWYLLMLFPIFAQNNPRQVSSKKENVPEEMSDRYPIIFSVFKDDFTKDEPKVIEQQQNIEQKPIPKRGFTYQLGTTVDNSSGFTFSVAQPKISFAHMLRTKGLLREDISTLLTKRMNLLSFTKSKPNLAATIREAANPVVEKSHYQSRYNKDQNDSNNQRFNKYGKSYQNDAQDTNSQQQQQNQNYNQHKNFNKGFNRFNKTKSNSSFRNSTNRR